MLKSLQRFVIPEKSADGTMRVNWELLALLRMFLAWIVLCAHLMYFAPDCGWAVAFNALGGKAAVFGFLLVSGISIGSSLDRDPDAFYVRRFLRVYPLYLVSLAFAFALEVASGGHVVVANLVVDAEGWKTDAGNLVFLQTFLVKPMQFDRPVWSLALEVFYYALAPLFRRMPRPALIGLIVFSLICYALPKHSDWGVVYLFLSKFNALQFLWCWLLGFMFWRNLSPAAIGIALAGVPLMIWGPDFYTPEPYCVLTYVFSLVVILLGSKFPIRGTLRKVFNYLGDISYPMYVIHFPTFILGYVYLQLRSPYALAALVFAVTILAFHFVDRYLKRNFIMPFIRRHGFAVGVQVKAPANAAPAANATPAAERA
jgi:peptidoglycan/LPS O-acetylase OafA/YrhL